MVAKVGSEITVDTNSTGTQDQPHITALQNGNYLATWVSTVTSGSSATVGIEAQVLDASGNKVGSEITVAASGGNPGFNSLSATTLSDGNVLVAWNDDAPPGDTTQSGISGRMLSGTTGAPLAPRFLINQTTAGAQQQPDIASLANGGFVATYTNGSNPRNISARVFTPVVGGTFAGGSEIAVTAGSGSTNENGAKVTALSNGGFAVAWQDTATYPDSKAMLAIYDGSSVPVGSPITLNTATHTLAGTPDIQALTGSRFVVTWPESAASSNPTYLRFAIYSNAGVPASSTGSATPYVDAYHTYDTSSGEVQYNPSITATGDGGFIVAYQDNRGTGAQDNDGGVKMARFTGAGVPVGDPILVNTSMANFQGLPSIAVDGTSSDPASLVSIVWADGGNGQTGSTSDGGEIRGQNFSLHPVFQAASVSGSALTLTYNVALDATSGHSPPTTSFAVNVDNLSDPVTGVSIDSHTVTLTLQTAIDTNQTVTVAYTDPSSSDDTAAVQDALGADASSLAATSVSTAPAAPVGPGAAPGGGGGGGGGDPGPAVFTTPTSGADVLTGTPGDDTVSGLSGDDTIAGGAGNDVLLGNQGNDVITAGDGMNTVYGGMDDDRITAGNGSNLLFGNEGSDTVMAGNGSNTIVGGVDSTDGADLLTSGSGNDIILGNGGADTVGAGAGADTVVGGYGNDVLLGNQGNDIILGNQNNDTLFGGMGNDTLSGGMDDDLLYGNEGDDVLYGNEGRNTFVFAPGDTDFRSGSSTGDTIMDFASGTSRIDFASGPAGTAQNFGAAATTSTDFAAIQALAQALVDGGNTYAFVADGTDGFLFTTGGSGKTIADAVKLAGAGTAASLKSTDIAHGAFG